MQYRPEIDGLRALAVVGDVGVVNTLNGDAGNNDTRCG